jgi:hypothetical protein
VPLFIVFDTSSFKVFAEAPDTETIHGDYRFMDSRACLGSEQSSVARRFIS